MRIRWKLLLLLLGIALIPLGVTGWLENRALERMGHELGAQTRDALIDRAGRQLAQLAGEYGTLVRRERETIQVALQAQAREVEHCLAMPVPVPAPRVLWAADYETDTPPAGATRSEKLLRPTPDGRQEPMLVTLDEPALYLAPGVTRAAVADDVARLASLRAGYQFLRQGHPKLICWQYTTLASGVHSAYPGHGEYPVDFDPRQRPWYRRAVEQGDLTWNPPLIDASTREVMIAVTMPVRDPAGNIVGVTGIDMMLRDLFQGVQVPVAWSRDAHTLIITARDAPRADHPGLLVIGEKTYLAAGQHWDVPIEVDWLESGDTVQLQQLADDVRARRPGLREMPYDGRNSLWAYGAADAQNACVLLVVPYDELVAQAATAENQVLQRTQHQLRLTGITVVVVAVLVFLVAFFGSRTVTRPIAELAEVAHRVARGDLAVRTHIRTRDELGELGRTVNRMIPQLADRMRMRHSLALAMEVQQRLLPESAPHIEGLDVAGRSIYCDETGGDYYDFLQLDAMGPRQLGVTVGDVTGHGIAAALLMATGRALLRSRLHIPGNLAQVITDINRQLSADTDAGRFMTLVYVLIDTAARTLRWVSGGHDAPLTYDPTTGQFGELGGGGLPLGIEAHWQYEEYSAPLLPAGAVIVLGTDGIWEARSPSGEMFGKDRLREVMRANAQRSADDISAAITTAVAAFRAGAAQEDDITLVVVKILP